MIIKETFILDDAYVPKGSRKKMTKEIQSIYPEHASRIKSDLFEEVQYLGNVGSDQFYAAKSIVTGLHSMPESRYKRGKYQVTEGDKKLANEIKTKCIDNPCAVTIRGKDKYDKYNVAIEYEFPTAEVPEENFEVKCYGKRALNEEFSKLSDAKSWITDAGKKGECLISSIKKVEYLIDPIPKIVEFSEPLAKVQFLRVFKSDA